jgi:hypothetical protein
MDHLFALPPYQIALVFLLGGLTLFGLSLLALGKLHRAVAAGRGEPPVAPFFNAVTTIWAVTLGFTAADIWEINQEAAVAAEHEHYAFVQLRSLAAAEGPQLPGLGEVLERYAAAVSAEWEQHANARVAPEAEEALAAMRTSVMAATRGTLPTLLLGKLMTDLDALEDARSKRVAIGYSGVDVYKWFLLLFLTVLSQLTIAAVHGDRPSGGKLALAVFAVGSTVSLFTLALHANPYIGRASVALPF